MPKLRTKPSANATILNFLKLNMTKIDMRIGRKELRNGCWEIEIRSESHILWQIEEKEKEAKFYKLLMDAQK